MNYIAVLFRPKETRDLPHSSGIYNPDWANKLFRGLERHTSEGWSREDPLLTVITDFDRTNFEPDITTTDFVYPERDWSSMMELFRPDVVGDGAILLGLDTIIVGSLKPIEAACKRAQCIVPLDPYHAPEICNAAVWVAGEVAEEIWFEWTERRERDMRDPKYQMWGKFSEMMWLRSHLKFDDTWDSMAPGAIASWKVDLLLGPPEKRTAAVFFHGQQKPHNVKQSWIRAHWV